MTIDRAIPLGLALCAAALSMLASAAPVRAELRISTLSVFLHDFDVTVHVVLFGALPEPMLESLHSGIPMHVRLTVELWQQNRFIADRRLTTRTIERQVTYNVLTKEYK